MASSPTADEDRRWVVLTMVSLGLALGLPSFALRGYVKVRVRKIITADDWIMLIAGVLWIGYIACQGAACANGFGAHTVDLRKDSYYYIVGTAHNGDVVEALRFWFASTLFHVTTSAVIRLSAGFTILALPHTTSRLRRWAILLDLTIATLASTVFTVLISIQCSPLFTYWSRNRADASSPSCRLAATVVLPGWYAFTALSLAANLILAFFALGPVLQRSISWPKRGGIAALNVFSIASITMSALQLVQVPALEDTSDLTFTAADFASYALLAPSLALVAANLAGLGPWLKELGWDAEDGANWQEESGRGLRVGMLGRGRLALNVMRGRGAEVDDAVLDATVEEGLGRLENAGLGPRRTGSERDGRI